MKCQYPGCGKKDPQYFICWDKEGYGMVCARHDKIIGRTNLIKHGFSLEEAIEWEKANRLVLSEAEGIKA